MLELSVLRENSQKCLRDRFGEHPPSNQGLTSASQGFGELELIEGRGVLEELNRGSELLTKVGDATAEGEMPTQLKETNQVTAAPTAMTVEQVREGVDIEGGMGSSCNAQRPTNSEPVPTVRPVQWCRCRLAENSVRSENKEVPINREIMVMVATTMSSLFVALFDLVASSFRTRAALQAQILALRHQLAVFQKNAPRRLYVHRCDRLLWVVLSRLWSGWRRCLQMVQPDTVPRWHRRAFAWHWTGESRRLPGRPEVASNIRDLIRRMSQAKRRCRGRG